MELKGKRIGFALTGSHCNFAPALPALEELVARGADVVPVVSETVAGTDTRFGTAQSWLERLAALTGRMPLRTIAEVEPLGPQSPLDALAICPCTGNTLAKIALAVTDAAVPMAAKAHLRNGSPLVIAISTNDGLGLNAKNLGLLLSSKNIFFVPFGQDNPQLKPNSIIADFDMLAGTIEAALEGRQLQPLLLGPAQG